ncbi:MAG: S1 family peptidase, partial [Burkholderiales bacterium]
LSLALTPVQAAPAAAEKDRAQEVFESARDKVLKIRVVLTETHFQASVGSGFTVSANGLVVTNFHVVSSFIDRPEQYRIEYVRHDGVSGALKLIDIDIVHDLALLRMQAGATPYFSFISREMAKGERGFSIGNPHDLGLTIVEGTYNGLIKESLYEHLHFTGAINPGMSGGPAITREGTVFGVNVARLVDAQLISFLVPVKFVARLLAASRAEAIDAKALLERARDQLLAAQKVNFTRLLDSDLPRTSLGPYRAPDRLGEFMRCWGRSEDEPNKLYRGNAQSCSSEDSIFVFDDVRTGSIDFEHLLLESRGMNWLRFYNLLEARHGAARSGIAGPEEDFTPFRCQTEFVGVAGLDLRAVLCVRAYKRLKGLYDFWLRAATLDSYERALQSTLAISGVSFEIGSRFVRRYLESIEVQK